MFGHRDSVGKMFGHRADAGKKFNIEQVSVNILLATISVVELGYVGSDYNRDDWGRKAALSINAAQELRCWLTDLVILNGRRLQPRFYLRPRATTI